MTGECYINGIDIYVEYGVTPLRGTFKELLLPIKPKSILSFELENNDGEEVLFPSLIPLLDARSITLPVALVAKDSADFFRKKLAFEKFLRKGAFLMFFPTLQDAFTCHFEECTQYSQLEPFTNKRVSATLELKLREPNPAKRTLTKEEHAYGVIIDDTISNADLTRIGNLDMGKEAVVNELAVQGTLSGGYLKRFRKGTALFYEDGTASVLDGSAGNVVTHHSGFYFLVEDVSATVHKLWVSPYPVAGFTFRSFTLGCYEAAVNNADIFGIATNAMWSVVNPSTIFRGGNNVATNDGLPNGFLQKARTSISRTNFYNYAQKHGAECGLIDYNAHSALWVLFVTKYATLNSQKSFSAVKDVNGYYAGGLGIGVSDIVNANWTSWNGNNPIINIGQNLALGTRDGVVNYTLPAFDVGIDKIVSVPSFMGIENPFGHLSEWVQGINIWKQTLAEGDKFLAYIYNNGAYEDVIGTKHSRVFEMIKTEGWIKNMILGSNLDTISKEVNNGASSSTFCTDYFYNSIDAGIRGLLRSGSAVYGSTAGLAFAITNFTVSFASSSIGSRFGFYGRVRPGV
jgi:hypothetical protein